ncbi:MAG: rod shape-determining protein MreD [Chloroflexota bacterium]
MIDLQALYAPLYGQPSLVLVAIIAWSWHSELTEAIFWAFVGGIASDLLNPIVPMGVSVIAPLVMVFAVKTIERLFYQVSIFTLIAFVAVGTILHHVIIFIMFSSQGIIVPLAEYIQSYSIVTLAFNIIGIMPMYWVLRRIQKRIPQRQNPWAVTPR